MNGQTSETNTVIARLLRFGLLIFLFLVSQVITSVAASAADRTLRILLDSGKIFPVLNVSASGDNGTSTDMDVRDCPEYDDSIFVGAFRFEVELALICNVVRDNDLADRLQFVGYPNLPRAMADLRSNKADIVGESVFLSEAEDGVGITAPIIAKGDFQVAIFSTPSRRDVLQISEPNELRALTGVTVQHWKVDKQTLDGMGVQSVTTARKMELIPPMIDAGRADFTLSYLDRPTTEHMGATLTRLDGFRVSLVDERVLVVSPSKPDLLDAFNSRIRASRDERPDPIRAAYIQSGFIVDAYDDWMDVTTLE